MIEAILQRSYTISENLFACVFSVQRHDDGRIYHETYLIKRICSYLILFNIILNC